MEKPDLIQITDGVQLCAVQTDQFKSCQLYIAMALPMQGDLAARAILPYILRRSCRKYPDLSALNGHLDMLYGAMLGGSVSKKGEAQLLQVNIRSIDDRFALDGESISAQAAQLLTDLLFDPKLENGTFSAEDVEIEKRLLLERMRAEDDDKRAYARKRCIEVMCADEDFGKNRFGTAEEIESLTPDRVFRAWREVLETATVRAVLVSSTDSTQVAALLRDRFASVERHVQPICTRFIPVAGEPKYVRETQQLKQGTLVMGFRCGTETPDDFDPAISVMTDMFGGGPYSNLFTVVREKMSLCYFCAARFDREKGIMLISSGIETENEEKTKAAILDQLRLMQEGAFTKELFDTSIRSLCDDVRGYGDAPGSICGWYGQQILRGTAKTPEERIAELENVRFEEIRQIAEGITLDTVFMLAGTGEETNA